jgi:hypothetical protein
MAGTNGGEGRQAGREGQRTFMSTGRRLADAQASDAIGMDARDNEGLAGAINEESANEARRDKKNARGSDNVAGRGNPDGSWKQARRREK